MNVITILFFAQLKEVIAAGPVELELEEDARVVDLKTALIARYPQLDSRMAHLLVSVNQQYAFDEDLVPKGAEIAIFPPVSGGTTLPTIFKITREALDLDELIDSITLTTTGAACIFTGMVRGETFRGTSHQTARLEYEAYIPMAEQKMAQVAEEIRTRWPSVEGIAIVQRIGTLLPRTPTVLIACTAGHRDTGVFEAARFGIDRLKEIVPVWKKEIGPDGEEWIEGDYHPRRGD